jgi:hypothetical protein
MLRYTGRDKKKFSSYVIGTPPVTVLTCRKSIDAPLQGAKQVGNCQSPIQQVSVGHLAAD